MAEIQFTGHAGADAELRFTANGVPVLGVRVCDSKSKPDGNGGWAKINSLPYDKESAPDVEPPGLDLPLGAGASVNLQYRFDVTPGNLWNARLHIGNVTWVGDLNL